MLELAANILIKEEVLSKSDQLSNQVVVQLLPFMVITSDDIESPDVKIAIHLSKSGICSLHPLLRGWKEGKKQVLDKTAVCFTKRMKWLKFGGLCCLQLYLLYVSIIVFILTKWLIDKFRLVLKRSIKSKPLKRTSKILSKCVTLPNSLYECH